MRQPPRPGRQSARNLHRRNSPLLESRARDLGRSLHRLRPRPHAWTAIVHEEHRWIYTPHLSAALGPGHHIGYTVELRHDVRRDGWAVSADRQSREATVAIDHTPPERHRFAVFSLARIPLAVHLGYILGDRSRVQLFHYDRDRGDWSWPEEDAPEPPAISWSIANTESGPADEAAIRVSLSAAIRPEPEFRAGVEIDIRVPEPSVRWLRTPGQLVELSRVCAEALAAIRACSCRRVHLYYAGPAAGAIAFGRAYNRRMNPPLAVYDFRATARPSYEEALVLNDRSRK